MSEGADDWDALTEPGLEFRVENSFSESGVDWTSIETGFRGHSSLISRHKAILLMRCRLRSRKFPETFHEPLPTSSGWFLRLHVRVPSKWQIKSAEGIWTSRGAAGR